MVQKNSSNNFESALADLEEIVNKMENGDLTLEESLQAFEQGIKLTKDCQKTLKTAEQKVNKLIPKDEKFALEPSTQKTESSI